MSPAPPPLNLRYRLTGRLPGTDAGPGLSGGIFLLPFDTRERVVADWTEAAMARIERNWIVPASARLAFAGRVQVTLTIERGGARRSLVIDAADVPEALTQAALHAVEASLPLPPLPENVAGESFTFTFVFHYNG
jgi:outer membrane biosynthesis protein TonB